MYIFLELETLRSKILNLSHLERQIVVQAIKNNIYPDKHLRVEMNGGITLNFDGKKMSIKNGIYPSIDSYVMVASSISFYIDSFSHREAPILKSILNQPSKFLPVEKDREHDPKKHNFIIIDFRFDV